MNESDETKAPIETREACEWCKFFIDGDCHRHSPVIDLQDTNSRYGVWPTVVALNWCGDFTRKHPE